MAHGSSSEAIEVKARVDTHTFPGKLLFLFNSIVNPANRVLIVVAAVTLIAMMTLTFADVSLRWLFKRPIDGAMEISEFMMGVVVAFSLGYCALRKGHIRVDLVMLYAPRKVSLILDLIAYTAATVYSVLLSWQAFVYVQSVHGSKLETSALNLPVYPVVFLVMLGIIFLTVVFVKEIVETVHEVTKK